jgi:hypothetical protein
VEFVFIIIISAVFVVLFAAVVRVLGTDRGYKVLAAVIVLYFVLVKR